MNTITGNESANGFGFCTADGSAKHLECGLTIRQHFTNSAPNDIPEWFVHVPPPPITIKTPELPKNAPEEHIQAVRDWRQVDAELPDELKWLEEAWDKFIDAKNKWDYENKKARFFQWRTFYADALIAELNKPKP